MAFSPVRPSQVAACIPDPLTTLSEAIRRVDMELPVLFYQWFSTMFNEDGTITDGFKADLCAMRTNCP